jgi:hypothetical protein
MIRENPAHWRLPSRLPRRGLRKTYRGDVPWDSTTSLMFDQSFRRCRVRLLGFEVVLVRHRGIRSCPVRLRVDGFGGLVLSFSYTPSRRRGI